MCVHVTFLLRKWDTGTMIPHTYTYVMQHNMRKIYKIYLEK